MVEQYTHGLCPERHHLRCPAPSQTMELTNVLSRNTLLSIIQFIPLERKEGRILADMWDQRQMPCPDTTKPTLQHKRTYKVYYLSLQILEKLYRICRTYIIELTNYGNGSSRKTKFQTLCREDSRKTSLLRVRFLF